MTALPGNKRTMQPEDILRIRWVSEPTISPDGRRVAYVVSTLDDQKNEYRSHIHVVDADGGEPMQLTNGPKRDTSPAWSPDGRQIAFVSERGEEKAQVWVISAEGGEAWRLTKTEQPAANPAWSPDGKRIAFTSRVESDPSPKGPDGKPYPKARRITTLRYKSNGEGIVEDRRNHIFLVDVDLQSRETKDAVRLSFGDFHHGPPKWSPDGTKIAFVSARHPTRDRDNASDVWVIDVPASDSKDRPTPVKVTKTLGPVSAVAWSPDGTRIAYLGLRYRRRTSGRHQRLWVATVDGGEPRCLTDDLDRNCATGVEPMWSSDGRSLLFGVMENGNCHVSRIAADGGAPAAVLTGERQINAARNGGGRIVFLSTDPVTPAEVFIANEDGGNERRLTVENAAWLEEVELGRPESMKAVAADGTVVPAWVIRPPGRSDGPVPCLLNVHGGPKTQYGNTFFDEFQVYAGAGYAIVYGNPRGADGLGEEWAMSIVGDWGNKDWQDVEAIADAAESLPFVDRSRIGVMGGSYGGFMTSWAVGHTDRFRAACSERAVNNSYSMVGTSDIGFHFQIEHVGALPYEDPERFLRMSPLHYAASVRTPLLIIHSENDLRCPMEQAEQLYVALKLLRRKVEFWRFPEDNHEMSRSGKPRNRLKRFEVILDWFRHQMA